MRKLKSLYRSDKEEYGKYTKSPFPRLNGIACPKCGEELYDTNSLILTSMPPKRNIHCECGYKGYRIA